MSKRFIGAESTKKYKINSIEKSYTLGFLWGDGNLVIRQNTEAYYPRFEITESDFDSIYQSFRVWGEWSIHRRHRENRKPQASATLCDKELGWFLFQNDYADKTYVEPTKILSKISAKLKPYWWRGFIDADGCFYTNQKEWLKQFSLAGSYELEWIEATKLFNKLGIETFKTNYRKVSNSESSTIRINNREGIIKLGNYIYADNLSIGLKRKQDKFLEIKTIPERKHLRGEGVSLAKLTEEKVKEMRTKYDTESYTYKELGIEYGVEEATVHSVIKRKTWKHVS
jgi:hypothetical protein